MGDDEKLVIEVTPDGVVFNRGLGELEKAADKSGKKSGKALEDGISKGPLRAVSRLRTQILAIGAAVVASFAVGKTIAAANETERAVTRVSQSLASVGQFSSETLARVTAFGEGIERTTTVTKEAAMELFSIAQAYFKTSEQAEAATKAALDFAAGAGISATEAVRRLGRAASGSIGDVSRFAPAIKNLTKEQLAAGEATRILQERFAGFAVAATRTFSGAFQQMRNSFGSIQSAVGEMIIKSPVLVSVMNQLSTMFQRVSASLTGMQEGGDVIGQIIIKCLQLGKAVNEFVIVPFEFAFNLIKTGFQTIAAGWATNLNLVAQAASKVANFFGADSQAARTIKEFADATSQTMKDSWGEVADSANNVFDFGFAGGIDDFLTELELAAINAKDIVQDFTNSATAGMDQVTEKAKEASLNIAQSIGGGIASTISQTVTALAKGENAFKAFGNAVLNVIGDMAIQIGTFLITSGIGVMMLKAVNGAGAIAAGAALVALGALLKTFSGGDAGASVYAGQPGSGVPGTEAPDFSGNTLADDMRGPDRSITVHVEGNILDRRESGLEIVRIIKENLDDFGGSVTA